MSEPESLLTVGEIARRLGQPLHRVEYVIRTRNIPPTGWAGHARVFHDADLMWIASELARIAQERGESQADGLATEDDTHGA
ncbi:MAG: hypothetical protein SH850_18665 [Planctomycetaceae bacterium]|nr:hypothetical protein [Planctomycetaceae bacterium]